MADSETMSSPQQLTPRGAPFSPFAVRGANFILGSAIVGLIAAS
jgi:hypothetical protein